MSNLKKNSDVPKQIELFDSWFAGKDEADSSRTLAFWDVIPWRLLSHKRKGKVPEIISFEGVKIDDQREATVTLTPAFLRDAETKEARVIFPSVREELVERALRKMAVHKLAATQLQANTQDDSMAVAISFSLYQLRQELIHTGHGHKLADIREALQVMRLCDVSVECQGDPFVHGKAGPILPTLEYVADPNDPDGKRTLYRVTFHPLASAAILGEFYHPIHYARVMTLTLPLARWLTNLLNVRFRYATRGIGEQKRSFRLTLKRVLSDSGMHREPRLFDNIERIREAIKELREAGFLDLGMGIEQIETLKYEKTAGRPKISGAEWELYPRVVFGRLVRAPRVVEQLHARHHVRHERRRLLGHAPEAVARVRSCWRGWAVERRGRCHQAGGGISRRCAVARGLGRARDGRTGRERRSLERGRGRRRRQPTSGRRGVLPGEQLGGAEAAGNLVVTERGVGCVGGVWVHACASFDKARRESSRKEQTYADLWPFRQRDGKLPHNASASHNTV